LDHATLPFTVISVSIIRLHDHDCASEVLTNDE
jgi:hypothetical protein